MNKEWVISQDAFDQLLDWLAPDREAAGRRYETIRLRLIKIFTCRGCGEPEDLADETINRVTAKVLAIATDYEGDPALYFYGVAQKVHLEYLRIQNRRVTPPPNFIDENIEAEHACLEQCMKSLSDENRDLVLRYYQDDGKRKIDNRRRLAEEMGIAVNALRIRAHRIRLVLQQCVLNCLEQGAVN